MNEQTLSIYFYISVHLHLLGPKQGPCEVPIVFLRTIIKARAGNLQGPYCISNDYFSFSEMIAFFTA